MTLVPWTGVKSLTWDVRVVDTLAKSHLNISSMTQGGPSENAASAKEVKYSDLRTPTHLHQWLLKLLAQSAPPALLC